MIRRLPHHTPAPHIPTPPAGWRHRMPGDAPLRWHLRTRTGWTPLRAHLRERCVAVLGAIRSAAQVAEPWVVLGAAFAVGVVFGKSWGGV